MNWKLLLLPIVVLAVAAGASVACSPEDQPGGTGAPEEAYSEYRDLAQEATARQEAGDYREALDLFRQALDAIEQVPEADPLRVARAHDDVARTQLLIAQDQDDPSESYQGALEHYRAALDLRTGVRGPEDLSLASSLDRLAGVYLNMEDFEQALLHYQQALELRRDSLPSGHEAISTSLDNLASAHQDRGDTHRQNGEREDALSHYQQALEFKEEASGSGALALAPILDRLSQVHAQREEYDRALEAARRSLQVRKGPLSSAAEEVITARRNLALLHGTKADLHFRQGEYDIAEQHFEKARATLQGSPDPDPQLLSAALVNLAVLYEHQGDYNRALGLLHDALETLEGALGEDHLDTVSPRRHLADIYFKLGDYQQAEALLQESLAIVRPGGGLDQMDLAVSLSDLGAAHLRQDEDEEALPLFGEALELAREARGAGSVEVVPFINNMAVLRRSMGDAAAALSLFEEALAIRRAQLAPDDPAVATSLNNLASAHFSAEEYEEARSLFQQALELRQEVLGPAHLDTAVSHNNLGVVHASLGEYNRALDRFRDALSVQDQAMESIFAVASEEQKLWFVQANQSSYHLALSLVHQHLQDDPEAVRFGMGLVLGRKGVVLDAQSRFQQTVMENLEDPDLRASWQRLVRHRGDLAHLLLSGPGDEDAADYRERIQDLRQEISREEGYLSRNLFQAEPELSSHQVTPSAVAANLPPDSALVEYVRVRDWQGESEGWSDDDRYLAFVVTSDDQVHLVEVGDVDQIDARVNDARKLIETPAYAEDLPQYVEDTDAALSGLHQRLLQPMEPFLEGRERLIVSPDGEVNKVPFAALRTPAGEYLVERRTISYVSSGRDLLRQREVAEPDVNLLMVADLEFGSPSSSGASARESQEPQFPRWNFGRLPGTADEATLLPPLVPGERKEVLRRAEGTETQVRRFRQPEVLHLATHGFFLEDRNLELPDPASIASLAVERQSRGVGDVVEVQPSSPDRDSIQAALGSMVRSGLALAGANRSGEAASGNDGILTALEVTSMDLRGTGLVVLSACQTAEGDVANGEGVFGLRRAFALAGARNLLMTQWRVSDRFTVDHMVSFYEEAFDQGRPSQGPGQPEDLAEALRKAQLQSIATLRAQSEAEFGEPLAPVILWAPFILQETGG